MKHYISIDHCPQHGFYAVSVGSQEESGWGSGTRLTSSKCCGSWKSFREWTINPVELFRLVRSAFAHNALSPCPYCGELPTRHEYNNPLRVGYACANDKCHMSPDTGTFELTDEDPSGRRPLTDDRARQLWNGE